MGDLSPGPGALFAYGSLRVPEVMEAVTGRRLDSVPARLPDHAVLRVAGAVYPGLVERAGAIAHGRLYAGLDERTLRVLDAFEDAMYERLLLDVGPDAPGGPGAVPAFVYRVHASHRGALVDAPWDFEGFEREHARAFARRCRGFWRQVPEQPATASTSSGCAAPSGHRVPCARDPSDTR